MDKQLLRKRKRGFAALLVSAVIALQSLPAGAGAFTRVASADDSAPINEPILFAGDTYEGTADDPCDLYYYIDGATTPTNVRYTCGAVPVIPGNTAANFWYWNVTGSNITYGTGTKANNVTLHLTTVNKPVAANSTYDGTAKPLIDSATVPAIAAGSYSIQYKMSDQADVVGSYSPTIPTETNPGTYTVDCRVIKTIGEAKSFVGTIAQVTTIISQAAGSISFASPTKTITFGDAAPTNALTNNGDGTVTYSSGDTTVATVDANTGALTIVGAGTTTITATVADGANYTYATNTATYTLTVNAANPTITANPAAVTGIEYNKTAQALINGGTAANGTFRYKLDDGAWSDTVPTATDAGSYTVYWYLDGDTGYNDVNSAAAPASIAVEIAKKEVGLTWGTTDFTYDGTEKCPTATATGLAAGDTCTVTVTGGQTNANTAAAAAYTATASALSNANYKLPAANTKAFTIAKADQTAPVLTSTDETYRGQENGTVTITGAVTGLEYSYTETAGAAAGGTWSDVTAASMTGLKAGGYTFRYKEDANHNASAVTTATIAQGAYIVIIWKNEDGTVLETDSTVKYGDTPGYDGATPTKPSDGTNNYVFAGWTPAISQAAADVTYTATFSTGVVTYNITYDLDGGTAGAGNPATYTALSGNITLAAPTKEGYTFEGWTGTGLNAATKIVTIPSGSTGDRSYKATWTARSVTITFDVDGGDAVASITQNYGTPLTPPADPFKVGYIFTGWSPAFPATMPADNIVVKAQWAPLTVPHSTVYAHTPETGVIGSTSGNADGSTTADDTDEAGEPVAPGGSEGSGSGNGSAGSSDAEPEDEIGYYLDIRDLVSDAETAAMIQSAAEKLGLSAEASLCWDIRLFRTVNGVIGEQIYEADEPITVTIELPENIRAIMAEYSDSARIVRIHGDVVETLECDYDPDSGILSFVSDKFSAYALVYGQLFGQITTPDVNVEENPVTGTPFAGVCILAAVSGLAAVLLRKRKEK